MTSEEIKKVLELHKKWINKEEGGERAVLSGTDLSEADLRGTNLSRADLREANLRLAVVIKADLSEADLSGAVLSGAELRWADLREVNLSRADLRGAAGADPRGAVAGAARRRDLCDQWAAHPA